MDHMVRAKRELEIPLLKNEYEVKKQEDKVYWESQRKQFLESHKRNWELSLQERERLSRLQDERKKFQQKIMTSRMEIYEKANAEREVKLSKMRQIKQKTRRRRN